MERKRAAAKPIEKPQVRMVPKAEPTHVYDSPESAKQMAVQKTLDLINSFKKEENREALQQSSQPEYQQEPLKQQPGQSASDFAVQKTLELIKQ